MTGETDQQKTRIARAVRQWSLILTVVIAGLFYGALTQREQPDETSVQVEIEPIAVFPDFSLFASVDVKKQMFFDFLELYVNEQNAQVRETREQLLAFSNISAEGIPLSENERHELIRIAQRYSLNWEEMREPELLYELLKRVDTIPAPLALAQAATESAWGTSRFALEGNNIFGQWCFEEGCGIVPSRRRSGATHEVKRFDSVGESISGYFQNINTHDSYRYLRQLRAEMRDANAELDPLLLASGLGRYSARGDHYVDEVQNIILQNDLMDRDQS